MKKIGIILILVAIMFQVYGQEITKEKLSEKQLAVAIDTNENTKVVIGKNLLSVEDSKDAVKLRVGNRGLNILESLEGSKFNFERYTGNDEWNQEDKDDERARRRNRFKGHWAGIEFGFNNYMTKDNSLNLPDDIYYMTLHSSKSNNFNLNFSQLSLGFTRHWGLVTGLGLNWNNYRFDNSNYSIQKLDNGHIEPIMSSNIEKSKFTTLYLTLPVVLEVQVPIGYNHRINLAAGGIGAIKLGSHTKIVYESKQKVKDNGDFSLNMLRYGATAHIGYENFQIYGTYYKTPMFKTGKGPGGYDLYPFEIGFAFTFND
jgi:hypothetical protein